MGLQRHTGVGRTSDARIHANSCKSRLRRGWRDTPQNHGHSIARLSSQAWHKKHTKTGHKWHGAHPGANIRIPSSGIYSSRPLARRVMAQERICGGSLHIPGHHNHVFGTRLRSAFPLVSCGPVSRCNSTRTPNMDTNNSDTRRCRHPSHHDAPHTTHRIQSQGW
jgi:hypothetical protein